jgi:hypothetical protein
VGKYASFRVSFYNVACHLETISRYRDATPRFWTGALRLRGVIIVTKKAAILISLTVLALAALACNAPAAAPAPTPEATEPRISITQPLPTLEATEPPATVEDTDSTPEPTLDDSGSAAEPTDITSQGVVVASSVADGYPVSMSVDGDPTTSWFSTGPDAFTEQTTYTWTGKRDFLITSLTILSNEKHSVPEFRVDYGFGLVVIHIMDASGAEVYTESIELPGMPDPNVRISPNVVGRVVLLDLKGAEAPDCGGFSELILLGIPSDDSR